MAIRQLKLRAHVQVTLETGLRGPPRVDDQVRRAATLRVQTSRTMAGLTSSVGRVCSRRFQPRMSGGAEVTNDLFVTIRTFFRPDELRTGNSRGSHDRAILVNCSTRD